MESNRENVLSYGRYTRGKPFKNHEAKNSALDTITY